MPHKPTSPTAVGGTHKLEDFIRRAEEVAIDTQKSNRTDDENWEFLQRHRAKKEAEKEAREKRRAENEELRKDMEEWVFIGKTQRERAREAARKERMRASLGLDGRAEQRPEAQN
jgi:hypothetical protein